MHKSTEFCEIVVYLDIWYCGVVIVTYPLHLILCFNISEIHIYIFEFIIYLCIGICV